MKRTLFILLFALTPLLVFAQVTKQKIQVQEVDFDTARTNHRGVGRPFWLGSGDTAFVKIYKDSIIIRGARPRVDSLGHIDTVAYLEDIRYWVQTHSGGSGPATIGDTVLVSGSKFYVMKYVPALTDSVYACVDLYPTAIAAGTNTYASGIITATNYTNPPGSYVTDDQAFDIRICAGVAVTADPGHYNLAEIYFATQIFRNDSVWKTMSDLDYSNAIGSYPYWDDIAHSWGAGVSTPMSYYVGGYSKYQQYYAPAPRNSFWDWGIQPARPMQWRLEAQKVGRATGQFGRETIGTHTGSVFIFGPQYTWPAHYQTLMTVDSSGTVTVYKDLITRAGTIKGYSAELSFLRLGFYPTMGDTTYTAYPDTIAGVLMLHSAQTGTAGIMSTGGNALAGFNETFWVLIDTITGGNDTLQTYGHSPKEYASGKRIEEVQADSNITLTMSGKILKIKSPQPLRYVGTTQDLKYIMLDSNMVAHVSHDTLHLAGTGGSGGAAAAPSYMTHPADKPPATANAKDDEFNTANGTMPDTTTKWRWLGNKGHTKVTMSIQGGGLRMQDSAGYSNGAYYGKFLAQKITDTAFVFVTKLTVMSNAGYGGAGIMVYDSVSNRGEALSFCSNPTDQQGLWCEIEIFTGQQSFGASPTYNAQRDVASYLYFRVRKTAAKVLAWEGSSDGYNWRPVAVRASTTYVETAGNKIDYVGIWIGQYTNTVYPQATFWWARYGKDAGWTPDFDPTINY